MIVSDADSQNRYWRIGRMVAIPSIPTVRKTSGKMSKQKARSIETRVKDGNIEIKIE